MTDPRKTVRVRRQDADKLMKIAKRNRRTQSETFAIILDLITGRKQSVPDGFCGANGELIKTN
jgi:hypothetical protein